MLSPGCWVLVDLNEEFVLFFLVGFLEFIPHENFKDMIIWNEGMNLATEVNKMTKIFPRKTNKRPHNKCQRV